MYILSSPGSIYVFLIHPNDAERDMEHQLAPSVQKTTDPGGVFCASRICPVVNCDWTDFGALGGSDVAKQLFWDYPLCLENLLATILLR